MMSEQDILKNVKVIFNACLSAGHVKTIEDAAAVHTLYRDIEQSLIELHGYRNKHINGTTIEKQPDISVS